MPMDELKAQVADGITFSGYEEDGALLGVMGIQDKGDVKLIRHAYVKTTARRKGIGEKLLKHLEATTSKPVLIGTWRDATWAIRFYEKNGFRCTSREETARLLRKYWSIPERQIETSVVLAK
jgi:GNAT superfamily N-acetyltransferase